MGRSLFAGETISKSAMTRSPLTWRIVSVRRISRAAEDTVVCVARAGALRDRQAALPCRRRRGRGRRSQRQYVGNNPPAVLLGHGIVAGRQQAAIQRLAKMGNPT